MGFTSVSCSMDACTLESALMQHLKCRPVAGGGAGGAGAPPEIFRLELISATKVEFCY